LGGNGQIGGSWAATTETLMIVYVISRLAVDALVSCGTIALGATGMAPLAVIVLIVLILHGAAEIDALSLVKIEVGIAS
jgi:hypothetical protein